MVQNNTKANSGLWLPIALQIALSALGFWTLWAFPYNNGLLAILKSKTEPGAKLPGPYIPGQDLMKQHYIGIKAIDNQLTILVSFFYTAIDGNRGDVSLSFFGLGGAVLAAWILITLEGLRKGNNGNLIIISTTVFGGAVAIVGYACVAPLWFAFHLFASSTVVDPEPWNLLVENPLQVILAPVATSIGFGLPSVIMCLPAPQVLSTATKQTWTGIQQAWSIWIDLATTGLTFLVSILNPDYVNMTPDETKARTVKNLRLAYLFALLSTAGSHICVWFLCTLAYIFPVLFAEPYKSQLQPSNTLVPVNPFAPYKAKTLADGALWFLQWDWIIGTVSTAIWGLTLRTAAKQENATIGQWISGGIKTFIIAAAVGPAGLAVVSVWARDELVLRRAPTGTVSKRGKAN